MGFAADGHIARQRMLLEAAVYAVGTDQLCSCCIFCTWLV